MAEDHSDAESPARPVPLPVTPSLGASGFHLTLITLKGHEFIHLGIKFPTRDFYGTH